MVAKGVLNLGGMTRWAEIRDYLHPDLSEYRAVTKEAVDGRESLAFRLS